MKSYHIITYGCQMNWSDSERIAGYLDKNNFQPTDEATANLVILNLCSVRQSAINRIWGKLNNIRKKNKKAKIVLTGCILAADKNKFAKHADYILDIKNLDNWLKIITSYELRVTSYKTAKKNNSYFSTTPNYNSKYIACVPVMTGCNNFCSYCAVPFVRGREISRPAEEIISEVNKLVAQGYKLITLLGQNVNSYNSSVSFPRRRPACRRGMESKKINFPRLLKLINSIPGNYWLSFITSHPKDMSDELIGCFKDCEHLIPYLHLPLQAGSDKTLKVMNRKYTAKHYTNLIRKIRKQFAANSHITISTDIIVGFPGETKTDFNQTAELMKKIKFDIAYLAEYSPRPGTAAAKLKDNISAEEKTRRRVALNEILKKTALENNEKMVGTETEVLIEKSKSIRSNKSNKSNDDIIYFGKTRNFKDIKITCSPPLLNNERVGVRSPSNNIKIGQFIRVKIIKAGPWNLEGKIIK